MRSDVECCPRFGQIAHNATPTHRHVAESDQTDFQNATTPGLSRFLQVSMTIWAPLMGPQSDSLLPQLKLTSVRLTPLLTVIRHHPFDLLSGGRGAESKAVTALSPGGGFLR